MTRFTLSKISTAAACMLFAATVNACAESYTILRSSASSISHDQNIDAGQTIILQRGEVISFTAASEGIIVQRQCSGPYNGAIRECTNASSSSRMGIPGGTRDSDE